MRYAILNTHSQRFEHVVDGADGLAYVTEDKRAAAETASRMNASRSQTPSGEDRPRFELVELRPVVVAVDA